MRSDNMTNEAAGSSSTPPMTFAEQMSQRANLQTRLTSLTSNYQELEAAYRKMGLEYYSLPIPYRCNPMTPPGAYEDWWTAFECTDTNAPLFILNFRTLHHLRTQVKTHVWKFNLGDAEEGLKAMADIIELLREKTEVLKQETISRLQDYGEEKERGLPFSSRVAGRERFVSFATWALHVPEIEEAIERKWGHGIYEVRGLPDLFGMACEVLIQLEGWNVTLRERPEGWVETERMEVGMLHLLRR